jgi:acetyl-CoA synthetase
MNDLETYHFYEQDWDSYGQLREQFEWNVPDTFNLVTYLCDRWAEETPDKVALYVQTPDGERSEYTYQQLETDSRQFANALAEMGIERGDRVALTAPQAAETLITHLAVWRLGGISVPLAPQFGPDALGYRVEDSGASVCVVDPDNVETITEARDDLDSLEHVLVTDEHATTAGIDGFWSTLEAHDPDRETVQTDADEDATLVYTSGTTGDPKGVRTPHRLHLGLLPGFVTIHCNMQIDDETVWRTPAGWGWMVFFVGIASLFYGKTLVGYRGRYDPETELRIIEEYDVTNWFAPPTVIRMMMNEVSDRDQFDVSTVRAIPTGGEAVGQSIVDWSAETFGNVTINEAYGQSEALLVLGECGALLESREGKMGKAVPGHEVDVVDQEPDERGNVGSVEPGEVGELAVRHEDNPVIFNGYWNMPDKTDAKFSGEWLLTEDLGVKDEDGYFAFHSRKDDVIICSGYRVSPEELEEKLATHEAVADAGVIGIPDETRGNVPKAFVTVSEGVNPDDALGEALQEYIKDRLAPYEYPREIEFIDELPTTPVSGKIQRSKLRERELE